jgi:hypothetical protein
MRWARHIERMGDMRNVYNVFVRRQKGRDLSEDMDINGKILNWILRK